MAYAGSFLSSPAWHRGTFFKNAAGSAGNLALCPLLGCWPHIDAGTLGSSMEGREPHLAFQLRRFQVF